MSNFSRGLLAATLTSSLAFAGATAASAEETSNPCGSPKAEFTATVDGKEHTFKKVSEFLWQATDDEEVELTRAKIFELAWDGEDVCDSEPIDIDDESDGNTGGDDEDSENGDGDESEGGDDDAENGGDDESDGNTGGNDDADNDDESEGGDDDADNDDESEGGDDADNGDDEDSENGDDDESEGDKDKNKDKSSFDGIKDALSSEDGKPTDLGIAAIVIGVLGALAAIVPNAARALGIKLPF